jgi:hypothetical protein
VRRLGFLALAVVVAAAAAGAGPECAHACTCAPLAPERALAEADAAFVGTLLERRVSGDEATLVFAVERRLKGPLGDRVEVQTHAQGGMCGIQDDPGARMGLFLGRAGDAWQGGTCGRGTPRAFAALPTAATGEEVADSFANATAYVLAVVALAGIGVFLLRRRFRPD